MSTPSVGLVYHPHFLLHDPGPAVVGTPPRPYPYLDPEEHVEHPRRVARIHELLERSGLLEQLVPLTLHPAGVDDLELFHDPAYVRRVIELSARDGAGDAGSGARLTRGSFEIALLAAGGAIAAIDAVLDGTVRRAYALVRPPGHHAVAAQGMGFCLFNNVAVAVRRALARGAASRVLIVDWDVHHGNGTQEAFYDDERVLFVSLHQEGLYPPDSGTAEELGGEAARGYTVNIPLPAGTGDAGYMAAFERVVLPIARRFAPDLIVVSNGLDASRSDPLGRMVVTADGYRAMTRAVVALADESAGGRLALVHEGGYSQSYAPLCGLAIVEELLGVATEIGALGMSEATRRLRPTREVGLDARAAIDEVLVLQRAFWDLPETAATAADALHALSERAAE